MSDPQGDFMDLYRKGTTLREIGLVYGLDAEEMGRALHYARLTKIINTTQKPIRPITLAPPTIVPTDYIWCAQCDRRVHKDNAAQCKSAFCKAQVSA